MMLVALLSGFVMAFLGSIPPTGPIAVLVLHRAVRRRYAEGLAIALGCAIVEGVYAALAVSGLSVLFARFPAVELGARVAGVVILAVLGVQFLRYRAEAEPEIDAEERARLEGKQARRGLALGFGIAAANPVLIVTWSTSVAMLYSLGGLRFDPLERVAFAVGVACGVMGWLAAMVALVRKFDDRVTVGAAQRIVRVAGGMMLVMALFFGATLVARAL